ncbi:hypothetical protein [Chelativorans xinjiangense]|uniref:hypothetical protein n=1 Tax=Chelativorans xinjiangense TaxID=2681485 RepID=UPI001357B759|nr:hypothetical protein [Chelativorans xinjiangense]
MMNMIERVARAICSDDGHYPDKYDFDVPREDKRNWEFYVSCARAAIEAMREPEVEMIAAFWRQKNNGTQDVGETGDARSDYDAYRAMIDAALSEETE